MSLIYTYVWGAPLGRHPKRLLLPGLPTHLLGTLFGTLVFTYEKGSNQARLAHTSCFVLA